MLELTSADLKKFKADAIVIPVCEDKLVHEISELSGFIKEAKKLKEFTGKIGDEILYYDPKGFKAKRLVIFGLGKSSDLSAETLRKYAGKAVKTSQKKKLSEIVIVPPSATKTGVKKDASFTSLIEGAVLGNHVFDKYKKEKESGALKKVSLFVKAADEKKYSGLVSKVTDICSGTILAREWVSTPSNDKRPEQFAKIIAKAAEETDISVTVMDHKELAKKKFGALLAVGQGSESRQRLVILDYKPKGARKTVAFVGKGVTFDTGGINLKPGAGMETMKSDMGGAAAAAAAVISVAKLGIKKRVIGVIPIVENMPSGTALRPGDVITSYSGKTIEIGNTDAEGRLILADAMAYTVETYKPDTMIDLATLTGACLVALGDSYSGVFSFDDKLAEKIVASGGDTHERCWQLPMPEDYKALLKSDIADINNLASSRNGGAITAALFLSEFTGDTQWAHIDIAGPSFSKKASDYCGSGGTGVGVRLLCDLIEKL